MTLSTSFLLVTPTIIEISPQNFTTLVFTLFQTGVKFELQALCLTKIIEIEIGVPSKNNVFLVKLL